MTGQPTDQLYYSAHAENAIREREAIETRVAAAVADGAVINELLQRGINSVLLVTTRPAAL